MFLNNIGTGIANSARRTMRLVTLATGIVTGATGCGATQANHVAAKAPSIVSTDRFTKEISHIPERLEEIRKSGRLTNEQVDSLTSIPPSNAEGLIEATAGAVNGIEGCLFADAQCAQNAIPVCKEFEQDIFLCPAYKERCNNVFEACKDRISNRIINITNAYRREVSQTVKVEPVVVKPNTQ